MTEEVVALLYTDVVNSTVLNALWGDKPMARLWAAHDSAARTLIRTFGGREVGRSDGFLVTFPNVKNASDFAAAYQRSLASLNPPLHARVGIHLGPIELRENSPDDTEQGATRFDIDGVALPVVARIMSTAMGRQILLSDVAHRALGPTRLRSKSHGYWRLKGLPDPIELIEVGEADAPFVPPPDAPKAYRVAKADDGWVSVADLPNTLPAERDVFIGRLSELQALAEQIEGAARLVTMIGIGGIGKTRLAVRYGRGWLGAYPGGAWFCDLSAARAPQGIVQAVAQGLDVPLGRADPVEQLGSAIAGRGECLIILDNFEQVARYAEDILGIWIERAPQAKFIVTSREVLGISGEETFVLGPLETPEAAEMFRQRVRALGLKGDTDLEDERSIGPLVELLDRLPLAIELAAARTRVMRPRVLLARMGERFKVLCRRGGRRDRQATLRAMLDWSWDLLSSAEKSALAQLSVFEGGFTLTAAEAVMDVSRQDPGADTTSLIQALLEKSLVYRRNVDRFDLLSTVQDYASEKLRSLDQSDSARHGAQRRHGEYFAKLDTRDAVKVCAERPNLVVATRRAAAAGDGRTAIAALERAWLAFKLRGPFDAGRELGETVLSIPRLDRAGAARANRVVGWSLKARGQLDSAETRLHMALKEAQVLNETACEGEVHFFLGDVLLNLGRVEEARDHYEAALRIAAATELRPLQCEVNTGLGNLCRQLGLIQEARVYYEAAHRLASGIGDRRLEGLNLSNLGTSCTDPLQQESYFEKALQIAREIGDRQGEGNALCNLGLVHQQQGNLASARGELESGLLVARELGHTRLECVVLCNLGILLDDFRLPIEARSHYQMALNLARSQGNRRTQGQVLSYLGLLHFREGRYDEGRTCLIEGEKHLADISDLVSLAILYCGRAEGEYLAGCELAAAAAHISAEQLADSLGAQAGTELGVALARVKACKASIKHDSAREPS